MNLGKILGTSPQHVILRTQTWDEKKHPEIGDNVFNAENKKIGSISDIFGPFSKPFISVRLIKDPNLTLESFDEQKGNALFTLPSKIKKKKFSRKAKTPPKKRLNPRSKTTSPPKFISPKK